jgi:hypothetical protein
MDYNKIIKSSNFKIITISIIELIVLLMVFRLGMFVGFRKAGFSYEWGDNYHRNFAGPRGGFGGDMMGNDFIEANGTFGQILKIDGQSIVVKGGNDVEKVIEIASSTPIKKFKDTVKITDLKIGDNIVVIGEPNSAGQIVANLIRVMPNGPAGRPMTPNGFGPR